MRTKLTTLLRIELTLPCVFSVTQTRITHGSRPSTTFEFISYTQRCSDCFM